MFLGGGFAGERGQIGFDLGLARLDALAKTLLDIAQVMGWLPDTNAPGRDI